MFHSITITFFHGIHFEDNRELRRLRNSIILNENGQLLRFVLQQARPRRAIQPLPLLSEHQIRRLNQVNPIQQQLAAMRNLVIVLDNLNQNDIARINAGLARKFEEKIIILRKKSIK